VTEHIFLTDEDTFQKILLFEYAASEVNKGNSDFVVHVLRYITLNEVKTTLLKLSGLYRSGVTARKLFGKIGIPTRIHWVIPKALPIKNRKRIQETDFFYGGHGSTIYPHLVEILESRNIEINSSKSLILKYLRIALNTEGALKSLKIDSGSRITTVNGRWVKNKSIVDHFRGRGFEVKIVDTGATLGTWDIWNSSQSIIEARQKMIESWNNVHDETNGLQAKIIIARGYLEGRRNFDPHAGVNWSERMTAFELPNEVGDKKICVFYSSTQLEFVGIGDPDIPGDFQNQGEALDALLKLLDPDHWIVILRMHPISPKKQRVSDEGDIWNSALKHRHLIVVPPASPVNSYFLAENATLAVHYNSSIGAELMFKGSIPVITVGPSVLQALDVPVATNLTSLRKILENPISIPSPETVLPFGYFYATQGNKFQHIHQENGAGWVIDGKNLSSRKRWTMN
jgi:hypothetical protein